MRLVKQGKTKKHVAILLVLAMLLTIMPMSVFAEGDEGSEPTPEVATPITLIGGESKTIDKAGLFDVTAQFTTAGMVQWAVGDVARGEAVEAAKITLEGETVVYTATLTGVTLTAEQTITATLTPTDGTEPVTATGTVAKEPEIEATTVAMIGNVQYDSLDEAIVEATDGATIKVLKDCETAGMNLSKNLTIKGDGTQTVSFNDKGIALWGKALTFENCKVKMNGVTSTPYTAEWDWMAICASANASLTLNNVTMTMDGQGLNDPHAIYFCSNNQLNLNYSTLEIRNYKQDAIEWDGGDGGYNLNLIDSIYISDNNRSGITGTFVATIDHSNVDVINSTGNGSNGTHFDIKNGSVVNFLDNGSHGLSAGKLSIVDSVVNANGNGMCGIISTSNTVIDKSTVTIQDNDVKVDMGSRWARPGALTLKGEGEVSEDSIVTITNNAGCGIYLWGENASLNMRSGIVQKNNAVYAGKGGGIYNEGTATISDNVELYNNHGDIAGDDIYNADKMLLWNKDTKKNDEVAVKATITFGATGFDWELDGTPEHCKDPIDGWYDDNETNRWEAHAKKYDDNYVVLYPVAKDVSAVLETKKALKAAHGLAPEEVPVIPPMDWEISKSKTATNLDKNFQSKVTLSLPAAEEELVTDVVFALDKSTSAALEDQALKMLNDLKDQIKDTNAKVKVGVVIFNKVANVTEFKDLATEYDAIEAAIKQDISSGTNTHAGLLAGKAMLDKDVTVQADRKYLIFVSDGITYMYNAEPTATAWSWQGDSVQKFAGPENWNSKYATNEPPADWMSWLKTVKAQVNQQGTQYEYPYGGTSINVTPVEKAAMYANSIDKALYLTYMEYQAAVTEGYHCYAMTATPTEGGEYKWGPSFMDYLAGGETVDFTAIQKDIYYLLDKGSTVDDYIGYVEDDYNFDFINDASAMTLKVGDNEYKAEKIDENKYGFAPNVGKYDYIVEYIAGDKTATEHFVWTINVPVSKFTPVQLTYTVQLMNPKSAKGTYGSYDEDGSKNNGSANYGLYTNNSATLCPIDSNGTNGAPEPFQKPTVSYKVDEDGPGPGPGPNPDPDPDKPTVDIPDPDVPLTEPDVPEEPIIDIDEPEVPLTDVPGEEVELDEPEVPLGDAPKTGDAAPVVGLVGLMAAAVIGLAITRRKLN